MIASSICYSGIFDPVGSMSALRPKAAGPDGRRCTSALCHKRTSSNLYRSLNAKVGTFACFNHINVTLILPSWLLVSRVMNQNDQKRWCFSRLTAMLLVATISIGTTVPLVWCFSGSGHSAIEFKVSTPNSESLDIQVTSHPSHYVAISQDNTYHPDDCVDRDAFPPVSLTSKPDFPVYAWIDHPAPQIEFRLLRENLVAAPPQAISPRAPAANNFPALEHLKTVLLLI